jgi:foldase protein PrsA
MPINNITFRTGENRVKNTKKLISAALVVVFSLSLSACNMVAKTPEAIAKSAVAKVNGEKITRGELDANPQLAQVITQLKSQYGDNYASNSDAQATLKDQKGQILDQMITEKLLLQKAKELKLIPDDATLTKETNSKYDEIKKVYSNDATAFANALKSAGFTDASLKEYLKNQVIISKVSDYVTKDVKVDEAKIKEYYNSHQTEFTEQPDTMDVAHILVKTQDEANKVKARLDKGEKFADVAKEVSTDTGTKDKGGDLGTVNYVNSGLDTQFMAAAMALKAGQISAPVQTQFGYHIIWVKKKTEYPVKPYDSVKETIKSNLLNDAKQSAFSSKIDEWKKAAKITKYDKNLI